MSFHTVSWFRAFTDSLACHRPRRRRSQQSFVEQLEVRQLLAAVIEPVVDFNTSPAGINVAGYDGTVAQLGDDLVILSLTTIEHGAELWRTDGTAEGTFRLTDRVPGPQSSNPGSLVRLGSHVYFSINGPNYKYELWRTDGTVAGTEPLRDAEGEVIDGFLFSLQAISDTQLTFERFSDLWVTDGTVEGTTQLIDLRPMNYSTSGFMTMTQSDGSRTTYIAASVNGVIGHQLLRYDWSTDAVQVLSSHEWLHLQAVFGSRLLFSARDAEYGEELWYSDGTPETTALWADLNSGLAGSDPYGFFIDGLDAYFSAHTEATGRELWKLTSPAVLPQLIEFEPGPQSSNPSEIVEHRGRFLTASRGVYLLDELDQPVLIDAVENAYSDLAGSGPLQAGSAGLYFIYGRYNASFNGLWLYSGANFARTTIRAGFEVIVEFVGQANGRALFLAGDDGTGLELWVSDGTDSGTQIVREIQRGTVGSFPKFEGSVNGHLVFTANAGYGSEFAQTESGYVRDLAGAYSDVVTLEAGSFNGEVEGVFHHSYVIEPGGSPFLALTTWDGSRFRLLVRLTNDQRLDLVSLPPKQLSPQSTVVAIYDTTQGTSSLWKIGADSVLSETLGTFFRLSGSVWETVDGDLYFGVIDAGNTSMILWQTDGTIAGTRPVPNFPVLGAYDSVLFASEFTMAGTVDDYGLSFRDTATGVVTTLANVFESPTYFISRLEETSLGLLFNRNGTELWSTSGTAASTKLLLPQLTFTFVVQEAVSSDGTIWFFTDDAGQYASMSLWKSDGTDVGTQRVVDLPSGKELAQGSFIQVGGRLVFSTLDRHTGKSEVWLSDGTAAGTFVISDDLIIGNITQFIQYDDGIAFIAANPEIGREIFRIDTTIPVAAPTGISLDRSGAEPVLRWDDSRAAVEYDVWLTNLTDPSVPVVKQRVHETQFELPAMSDTTAYRVWVRSVPVLGEPSAWSSPFEFTPGPDPLVYSVPPATTDTTPTFRWVGTGDAVSFELWVTHRDTKTRPIYYGELRTTSFTALYDLALGRYAVWVRETRSNGTRSNWSPLTEFDILLPAIRVTSASVSRSSRPLFTWNAVSGTTQYELIVRHTDGSVAYTATGITGTSHTSLVDLSAGSYSVHVRALNGARPMTMPGTGDALHVLLPPRNIAVTSSAISWLAVTGALTYTVELRNAAGTLLRPLMTVNTTSVTLTPPLVPGQYSVRVYSNFRQGSSAWSEAVPYELFRPATTRITSSNAPTADATPTIVWAAVTGASGYELRAARTATGPSHYSQAGIATASHRIATALPAGVNFITVRALFADGSRTHWSTPQQLLIGPAPTLSYAGRTVSWSPINQATHFELWINYLGTPVQPKIVYDQNYVANSYLLTSSLPKGRYQIWLRAIRGEGGELYAGLWTSISIELT